MSPAHVPDAKMRGQHRAQKVSGHSKGGEHWRNYGASVTVPRPEPGESFWLVADPGKSFTAQAREHFTKYPQKAEKGALPPWVGEV